MNFIELMWSSSFDDILSKLTTDAVLNLQSVGVAQGAKDNLSLL